MSDTKQPRKPVPEEETEDTSEAPPDPAVAHRAKLEADRAAGIDLPTGQRRDHPPA